jgi:formamidopyrimidine-DNA glycosylase
MAAGCASTTCGARDDGSLLVERPGDHWLIRTLGPEPLGPEFDGAVLAAALEGKRTPIKAALLDQRVVAGLGNIYVSRRCSTAGISPRRLPGAGPACRCAGGCHRNATAAIEAGGSSRATMSRLRRISYSSIAGRFTSVKASFVRAAAKTGGRSGGSCRPGASHLLSALPALS